MSSFSAATDDGTAGGGCRSGLDRDQLPMFAPRDAEPIADLADGRVGADRVEDRGHEVPLPARDGLEPVHRRPPVPSGSLGPDPPDPLDLAALSVRIDPVKWRRADLV